MEYTAKQIENAKENYNAMLVIRTVESYDPQYIGWAAAEQRCEYHNRIASEILAGNKELEKEWKLFFLKEEVKSDQKSEASKAKLNANKEASADILAPIKVKSTVTLLTPDGVVSVKFRKEHFSKKYTQESVNEFLATL
nr:hypothetical protein [uncultured Flavobacterium sp.]